MHKKFLAENDSHCDSLVTFYRVDSPCHRGMDLGCWNMGGESPVSILLSRPALSYSYYLFPLGDCRFSQNICCK